MRRMGILILLTGVSGCTALVNSPIVTRQLQIVTAGHTGCLPEDNQLSNINASADGSGTWNATCKGKVYLCSTISSAGSNAGSYSCAPVAQ